MKSKYSIILLFFLLISFFQGVRAQIPQLSDSSKVSLLTNTPWDGAVYALYGHTALRIEDVTNDIDLTFNYGLFDFDSPNFMYRFVKGETDYSVGYDSTNRYILGYQMRGIGITQQNLNLSTEEKQKIFETLLINCLPENRVYRYNYFYDNCSTRPRDIVEKSINGVVLYNDLPEKERTTYRKLVHECVKSQPWVKFGIDLVIGEDADKQISTREEHFLPAYLMKSFQSAIIKNPDNSTRKLVVSEDEILKPTSQSTKFTIVDSPLIFGVILLTTSSIISYISYKKKNKAIGKIFDVILFFSAGIAGSIIFFLMYFSIHPCTNPNWNIVWLNPLQLIFTFLFLIKSVSKGVYYYHFINFAVLIVFLLAWLLIPQYLEVAFIPYILTLAIRSGANVLQYRKKH